MCNIQQYTAKIYNCKNIIYVFIVKYFQKHSFCYYNVMLYMYDNRNRYKLYKCNVCCFIIFF